MQSGLSAGINHGSEGRSLTDIAAYNLAAKADYISAPQRLRNVDFPLLGPLVDAPETSHLQPDIKQLTLHIHRSEDQVVLGETSLSFYLSVAHSRVERIRESVAAQRPFLADAMVSLVEPLSAKILTGANYKNEVFIPSALH
ncbi:hypothetical protein Tco_1573814 [Tanacetum coccineum]